VLRGNGTYHDVQREEPLVAGSLVLVFPGVEHTYGPGPDETWDELFVVFGGPVFDAWRTAGLLDPARPVLSRDVSWADRLEKVLAMPVKTEADRLEQLGVFQSILGRIVSGEDFPGGDPALDWLGRARAMLESDLSAAIEGEDVARALGLGYETFRKTFARAVGVPPARYRTQKRIAAACQLLLHTHLSNRQIADQLGFADEFVFSKRFRAVTGRSPREFRHAGPPA
jgi:AraC-like DNA-binding protein